MQIGRAVAKARSAGKNAGREILVREALEIIESRQKEMLEELQELVEFESPSSDKAVVDLLGAQLAKDFADLGGEVTVHSAADYGDHLQVDFPGASAEKPTLLLGHFDTVWDV